MIIYEFRTLLDTGIRTYINEDEKEWVFQSDIEQAYYYGKYPIAQKWVPLHVHWTDDDRGETVHGDVSRCHSPIGVILSPRAMEVLQPYLQGQVEFLPLICDEPNVSSLMRVVNFLDFNEVVDVKESVLYLMGAKTEPWDPSDGIPNFGIPDYLSFSPVDKNRFIFNENVIGDSLIFQFRQTGISVFVTDKFKDIIETNNLIGAKFRKYYPLAEGEDIEPLFK